MYITWSVSARSSSSNMVLTCKAPAIAIPPLVFILLPLSLNLESVSFTLRVDQQN